MRLARAIGTMLVMMLLAPEAGAARARFGAQHPPLEEAPHPAPPGDYERALAFGGGTRYYELHVPPGAKPEEALPVVIDLHGGGGSADGARRGTHMDAKADRERFLVVYPQGVGLFPRRFLTWNAGNCCGRALKEGSDDVGFVRAILDDLPRFARVDEKRVFATGFSNGSMMAHRLGCELSERIAAIACVSGPLGLASCAPARPVPVLHIHGTADQNAPYRGGNGAHALTGTNFRSVADTIALWRRANRAVATPQVTRRGAATIERWAAGPGGAEVELITIEGQGHRWPAGDPLLPEAMVGQDVGALNATDAIWDFFKAHALDARR